MPRPAPPAARTLLARARLTLRIVSINDVYELTNLPRLQTFLAGLADADSDSDPKPSAVVLAGDFLSPSTLSSIDGGRGMVSTLRAVGMTHVSLGNHEQDLRLRTLRQRLEELSAPASTSALPSASPSPSPSPVGIEHKHKYGPGAAAAAAAVVVLNTNMQHDLPPQAEWMRSTTKPYSLVSSHCGRVTIALLGLLSDEQGLFRDNTFKSVPIQNVLDAYTERYHELVREQEPRNRNRNRNRNFNRPRRLLSRHDDDDEQQQQQQQQQPDLAKPVDLVLPLTHASMVRDKELAQHMLALHGGSGVIIGGHEHDPYHEIVTLSSERPQRHGHNDNDNDNDATRGDVANDTHKEDTDPAVHIVKSGMDARNACLVDLVFEVPTTARHHEPQKFQSKSKSKSPPNHEGTIPDDDGTNTNTNTQTARLVEIRSELVDLSKYPPAPSAQKLVDQHMSVVRALEDEIIIEADSIVSLPPGELLSSKRSRFQQTTMAGVFCQMIKEELEELECDVALLNGAVLKGDAVYETATLSYAQLKRELPFPTKIVLVEMTDCELEEAIRYSRTALEAGTEAGGAVADEIPRRGYLQVDCDYDRSQPSEDTDADASTDASTDAEPKTLRVALPRNLLNGFCKIKPLMAVGERLKDQGTFPGDDDFVPAIDLIVRHASKTRWLHLVTNKDDFDRFDTNGDAVLDRHEIRAMMSETLGYEPADFVVDDMVAAIDADEDGTIDHDEFCRLLSQIERDNDRSPKQ